MNDYVNADAIVSTIGSAITFGAWIYPESGATGTGSVLAFNSGQGGRGNQILYLSGQNQFSFTGTRETIFTSLDFPPERWYHVMVTIDSAGNGAFYVNGVRVGTFVGGARPDPTGHFSIGQRYNEYAANPAITKSDFFKGTIDEVEVYPRALSAEEVATRFDQPVFHVTFDQSTWYSSSGIGWVSDVSGYDNDASCIYCPNRAASPLGTGVYFDPNASLSVQKRASLQLDRGEGNFSVSAWIKIWPSFVMGAIRKTYGVLGSPRDSSVDLNHAYPTLSVVEHRVNFVRHMDLELRFGTGDSSCSVYTQGDQLASTFVYTQEGEISSRRGRWVHALVTFGPGVTNRAEADIDPAQPVEDEEAQTDNILKVYIDGQELPSAQLIFGGNCANAKPAANQAILGETTQFTIGQAKFTDAPYGVGDLDDVRIYRRALSAVEVEDIYLGAERQLELRFDEPPGSTLFQDELGNRSVGNCAGNTCPVSGVPGRADQAVRFDGVDDYVDVQVDVPEQGYLASLWFQTQCANCGIFSVDSGVLGSGGHDRHLYLQDGNICARVWNHEAICTTGNNYADGRWHHLAHAIFDAVPGTPGGQSLFVDSEEKARGTKANSDFTSQTGVNIGFSNDAGQDYFAGFIDHVTVSKIMSGQSVAKTVARLAQEVPAMTLHLDEPLGSTSFRDEASPISATCFRHADPQYDRCPDVGIGVDGAIYQAASFDGINDYLAVDRAPAGNGFSVALWVNPAGGGGSPIKQTGNFELGLNGVTQQVGYRVNDFTNNVSKIGSSQGALVQNQWNHLLLTFDGRTPRLYINGLLDTAGGNNGPFMTTARPEVIIGQGFRGGIDEVLIYPTALDAQAVADLYVYQWSWFDTSYAHTITVDADDPTVNLELNATYISNRDIVLAITAQDPTSAVTAVEFNADGAGWQAATRGRRLGLHLYTRPHRISDHRRAGHGQRGPGRPEQ